MSLKFTGMRNKSVNIDVISNGFTVDLDTPSTDKDTWSDTQTFACTTLDEVFDKVRVFLG